MMKSLAFAAGIICFASSAFADQTTLLCSSKDLGAAPYLSFEIQLQSAQGKSALVNPETFSIKALSLPESTSSAAAQSYDVEGCQNLRVKVDTDNANKIDIECGEDGEGGRGSLEILANGGVASGYLGFPNGLRLGETFIEETLAGWELLCRQK